MKKIILRWTLGITATGLLLFGILIAIVLNPGLLYANKTTLGPYRVFHNRPLDAHFKARLDEASALLKASELYDAAFTLDICLNDGSRYPALVQCFQSPAFGIGFYNKVVIMGSVNAADNYVSLNGYKWNLTQLLAHEALHCFQYHYLGLWKSNPLAGYPNWKWEGYNEYIARQNPDQKELTQNMKRYEGAMKRDPDSWGIAFADSTFTGKEYYQWWMMMQYCEHVKKMNYFQILKDTHSEENVRHEMMDWYAKQ